MKRILLAILLAGCTLAMSAQMKVNYKGSKPAIDDFIWALVTYSTEETDADHESINAVRDAMERYRQGASQPKNITFTVDKQNGYALYESKQDETLVGLICAIGTRLTASIRFSLLTPPRLWMARATGVSLTGSCSIVMTISRKGWILTSATTSMRYMPVILKVGTLTPCHVKVRIS